MLAVWLLNENISYKKLRVVMYQPAVTYLTEEIKRADATSTSSDQRVGERRGALKNIMISGNKLHNLS